MFEPSQKQREAIFKMESFAGISNHRDTFESLQSFQEYWELVDKKCKKKKRFDEVNRNPELKEKVAKLREAKIQRFYQDEAHLYNYGKKYFDRYLPSFNKLKKKLQEKCNDAMLTEKALARLTKDVSEQKLVKMYASRLFLNGASIQKIKQTLYQKEFKKDDVEIVIKNLQDEGSAGRESGLERMVNALLKKNKSRFEIEVKLNLQGAERNWLQEYLQTTLDENIERDQIKHWYEKFSRNNTDKKAIIKKITAKGFSYRLVSDIVNQK